MPELIVTSRRVKLNSHKRFGNYIKYITIRVRFEKPTQIRKIYSTNLLTRAIMVGEIPGFTGIILLA